MFRNVRWARRASAVVVLVAVAAGLVAVTPDARADVEPAADEVSSIIVKMVAGLTEAQQADVVARDGGVEVSQVAPLRLHAIEVPTTDLTSVTEAYRRDPKVQRVESDIVREVEGAASDPAYADQWALPKIGWDSVHGAVTPSGAATIAVVDTGVAAATPDLANRLVPGFSAFADGDPTTDPNGHGTWLASIAAAEADNDSGIAGVAFAGTSIMPIQALDASGLGQDSDIIAGVVAAADAGADVILMGFSNPSFSPGLQEAVDYAWSKDAVLVAATGNDGTSVSSFPAGDAKVVGVSATDQADVRWSGSNYGVDTFLAAPGVDIAADTADGGTTSVTGTSASAAVVAGAAALLRAIDPAATNGIVVGRLARTADPAGTVEDSGNGRVNIARAATDSGTDPVVPAGVGASGGPFVGPYVASAFKVTLQGISPKGGSGWSAGNLAGYQELDLIPTRTLFIGGPVTGQVIRVDFDHTKSGGTFVGIENLTSFTTSSNVTITSGPTLSAPPANDIWSYTFTVTVSDNADGFVQFNSRLGAGAHFFTGNSLNLGGLPASMGNLQIAKPAAKPGSPDLTLTKTGPATAGPGTTITYDLAYSNKAAATSSGTGAQLRDVIPAALTYVAGSCTPTCSVVGNTITWDLGTLAPGATGSKSYQATVAAGAAFGSTFTNSATIRSAENDVNLADNDSSVTTTVTFNRAPTCANGSATTAEDTATAATLSCTDLDGNALTYTIVSGPAHGVLSGTAPNLTYTPATDYSGPDSFTFKVNDGTVDSNTATFSLTVTPVNDAPVAVNDSYTTSEDTAKVVTAPGVLDNDTDTEGSSLTAALVAGPTHGSLTLNANGSFTYTPTANYNGPDSFTYKANDGTADSNVATVSITVTATNDAPVAANDSYGTNEDASLVVPAVTGVLANDTDTEGSSLTAILVAGPTNGSVTLNADGSFTYAPNANYAGTDSFTYKANDGTADSNAATVSITVTAVNDAPVAVNDSYTTNEDTSKVVTAPGVLDNDTDTEGSSLTAVLVSDVAHGTLTLNTDGSFTYTPAANFNGLDTFTYKANDGTADSNVATVSITVTAVNDAPVAVDDSYTTNEDTSKVVTAPGVLGNDTDTEGSSLTAILVAGPANGSVTLNADGSFTYAPNANYAGADSFTYKANDGTADSNAATVSITVTAVNDAPVAVDDSYTTNEDTSKVVTAPGVLANDTDTEGSSLTAAVVAVPTHGSVTLNSDGSFTYVPDANFNGPDGFTYTASDGIAGSNVATVSITVTAVNDEPSFTKGTDQTVLEDAGAQSVSGWASAISKGPANESAQLLDFVVTNDNNGLFSAQPAVSATGTLTFTPAPNANGSATVSVYLHDDGGIANGGDDTSATQTFTITVTPVNDEPSFTKGADQTVSEDSGPSSVSSWAAAISKGPANESAQLLDFVLSNDNNGLFSVQPAVSATGTLTFTPAPNANGSATVSVYIHDNGGTANGGDDTSPTQTFTITVTPVNDAPVAVNDSYDTSEDASLVVPVATGVLANDTDTEASPLTAALVAGPTNGSVTLNADGSFTYTPAANYNGPDSFTYKANDGTADSNVATVSITVTAVNDAPVAANDSYTTNEDTAKVVTAPGVLLNDTDVDGDAMSAAVVAGPTHGSLTLAADGSFTYTPDANYNGPDSFTYKANDGTADSNVATVSITVTSVNDAPVAVNDSYTTLEDTAKVVVAPGVLGNDTDVDEDALSALLVAGPTHGSLTLAADGSFTYTPDANFNGPDSFTYTASDGIAGSNVATVSITVTAVNDEPSFTKGTDQTVLEDAGAQSVSGWASAISKGPANESAQLLDFVVTNDNNTLFSAQPAVSATGTLTFTPAPNANGSATVSVYLHDDGGIANGGDDTSATQTFTITVTPVNDEPSFTKGADQTVSEDSGPSSVSSWAAAISKGPANESAQLLDFVLSNDNNGLFSVQPAVSATGTLTFTPAPNANGSATVSVYLHDNGGTANGGDDTSPTQTFTITVTGVNDAPVAANDSYTTNEDTAKVVTAPGVLGNDTDVDGDALSALLVAAPTHGSLTLAADGSFTYTPDANYNGPDSFTYKANDGTADSNVATVSITVTSVNDAPVAVNDSYTTLEDTAKVVVAPGVLGNDTDVDEDALSALLVAGPTHGSLTLAADGSFTYTPDANFNGPDSFTYTASDGIAGSNVATVSITVTAVNDEPSFTKGTDQTVLEDAGAQSVSGWASAISKGPANESAQLLDFVVTNDNNTLFSAQPAVSATGTLTFTPAPNANGSATVTVSIHDNGGTANGGDDTSPTQTFTITVTPVNDEPSFTKGADQTVSEDSGPSSVSSWAAAISKGPANESAQLLDFVLSNDNNGLFSVQPAVSATGTLTFTPAANANGSATVSVYLHDNGGTANGGDDTSATQTFTITVTPVNDAPVINVTAAAATGVYSDPITPFTISATDLDSPTSSLTFSATGLPSALALVDNHDGTATVSGKPLVAAGPYNPTYSVMDGAATTSASATFTVTKETAALTYTGDSLRTTSSTATNSTSSVNLSATVLEDPDGNLGTKLNTTQVRFTLYRFSDLTMSSPIVGCTAANVVATGPGAGLASCTSGALAADNYVIKLELLVNGYYTAPVENGTVTVVLAGTGFTTGGGWIDASPFRSNFGFTVKYLKNGNIQGNSLYIYRQTMAAGNGFGLPAGEYNWIIKSNAMLGLTQSCTTTAPKICTATFTGKNTITAVNRATGVATSLGGNYQFQVDVTDAAEPGSSPGAGPDRYAIKVWNSTTPTYYQLGSPTAQVAINGGNIQVRL